MSKYRMCMLLLLALLLAACGGNGGGESEEVSELPTLIQFDTPEPTPTPEDTTTPTLTFTPTEIFTLTPTLTFTSTLTNTPARTNTPAPTNTPRASATFTITPTETATETPVVTATPSTPQIVAFTSSTSNAVAGGQVTLTWDTIADSIRIDRLNQQGAVLETFNDLTVTGSRVVTIPSGQGSQAIYRLAARRGVNEVTSTLVINISGGGGGGIGTPCQFNWFFGNQIAPPEAGCPIAAAATGEGAFQPFERGRMIAVTLNGQNLIYGLVDAGGAFSQNTYLSAISGWDGGTGYPGYACAGDPPASLVRPQRMFAWMYCNTNSPAGSWNSAIGWANATIDNGQRTIQFEQSGAFYMDSPSGVIYRFDPIPLGGTTASWRRIN